MLLLVQIMSFSLILSSSVIEKAEGKKIKMQWNGVEVLPPCSQSTILAWFEPNVHDVAEFGSGFNAENSDEFSGVQGVRE